VAARFASYGIALQGAAAAYCAALVAWPDMTAWRTAAAEEPWTIAWP